MPIVTRTFRVFVSSTFEDLKEERDALQREVFPKLRTLCEQHGARFQAVDLRWGVREEAGLDQKTMEICLTEIARCQKTGIKPNFIVLLGDRYGWRPLPGRIKAAEFEMVRNAIGNGETQALVDNWYQQDDNAVPPEYLLKPRAGELINPKRWGEEVERPLGDALRRAANAAGLASEALLKYEGSATHQEIVKGLGKTPEDRRHVFAFVREGEGSKLEDPQLRKLKTFFREQLDGNVITYQDGNIGELCKAVVGRLEKVILKELSRSESIPELGMERKAQSAFARNRRRHFNGRQRILAAILDYVKNNGPRPLVLQGVSGCGKSAIMAQAAALANANARRAVTIRRFIGITPTSSNGFTLLRSICEEIATRYKQKTETLTDFNLAVSAFRERLALATADRPLHLFIDALDQLDSHDQAAPLTWLPAALPPHCRVVISTIDAATVLRNAKSIDVHPFPLEEADYVLSAWLNAAGRTLRLEQRHKLLDFFKRSGLPLYLKLAYEEARRWRSFDPPGECGLAEGIDGIIDVMFKRLSADADHGPVLVRHSLGYLAAARYGLTEDEVLEVLANDEAVWKDCVEHHHAPPERRLPTIIWSRLHFDLEPYLTERAVPGGTVISFFHRQLLDAAYFGSSSRKGDAASHGVLADYFSSKPTRQPRINVRKISELPYQETLAGHWERLDHVIGDLDFAGAKIEVGLLFDFIEDCDRALRMQFSQTVLAVSAAIRQELFSFGQEPMIAVQTLYNRLRWTPNLEAEIRRIEGFLDERGFWLRAEGPLPAKEVRMAFAESRPHQYLSPNGRAIAAANLDGAVEFRDLESGEHRLTRSVGASRLVGLACSSDYGRIAWLEQAGTIHVEGITATLLGRTGDRGIAWHPEVGIIAARSDNALVGWSPDSNEFRLILEGLAAPLAILRLTRDCSALIYVAGRQTQMAGIVFLERKIKHITIPIDTAPIVDVDYDPGTGLLLLLTLDRTAQVVHASTGVCHACLPYETVSATVVRGRPSRCAFGDEGGTIAFLATEQGHVAQWDTKSGTVHRLADYCAVADRSRLCTFQSILKSKDLFLSTDSFGSVWTNLNDQQTSEGHGSSVSACCFTPSGDLVTASQKANTLLWSFPNLETRARIVEHNISAIAGGLVLDEIIVGTQQGDVWTMRPTDTTFNRGLPGARLLNEAILCVCHDEGEYVIATGKSGRVLRFSLFHGNSAEALCSEKGYREQQTIAPAGPGGAFWSLRRQSSEGGARTVFSVVQRLRPELQAINTVEVFSNAASTQDGTIAGIAGQSVRLFLYDGSQVNTLYRRNTPADMVAFIENSHIAVSMPNKPWLEVWRVQSGLPTVAAIHSTSEITALAACGRNVVAGLRSGKILSLQLRGRALRSR